MSKKDKGLGLGVRDRVRGGLGVIYQFTLEYKLGKSIIIIRKSNLSRGVSKDYPSSSYSIYHNLFYIYFIHHLYIIFVIKTCNL